MRIVARFALWVVLTWTFPAAIHGQASSDAAPLVVWGFAFDELTGEAIDATLTVASADTAWSLLRLGHEDITRQGYELAVPRDAALQAHAPGYLLQTRQATVSNGIDRTRLDFHLRPVHGLFEPTDPTCDLTGTVRLEPDGTALEAAQVWLALPDGRLLGALSTAEGRYTIASVPAGLHMVFAELIGYARESRQLLVRCTADEELPPLTFFMRIAPVQLSHIGPGKS